MQAQIHSAHMTTATGVRNDGAERMGLAWQDARGSWRAIVVCREGTVITQSITYGTQEAAVSWLRMLGAAYGAPTE